MAATEEHEILVHLGHGDHGKAFWSKLGRVMPDHERRQLMILTFGNGVIS